MNRRAFLSTLAAGLTGLTLDPERLLWRPGAKTIFLPPKPSLLAPMGLARGDLFTIEGVYAINPRTYMATEWLQQFVITDDVRSGASVRAVMTPPIVAAGHYQNVTRAPFAHAKVQPLTPTFTYSGQKMAFLQRTAELPTSTTFRNG